MLKIANIIGKIFNVIFTHPYIDDAPIWFNIGSFKPEKIMLIGISQTPRGSSLLALLIVLKQRILATKIVTVIANKIKNNINKKFSFIERNTKENIKFNLNNKIFIIIPLKLQPRQHIAEVVLCLFIFSLCYQILHRNS